MIAEPRFWYRGEHDTTHACFGTEPLRPRQQYRLEDHAVQVVVSES